MGKKDEEQNESIIEQEMDENLVGFFNILLIIDTKNNRNRGEKML